MNRANARRQIFEKERDFLAFERVLAEAVERTQTRLLAYCVMPNHWHLVVWPRHDGELSRFVGWLTLTHTQRWHAHRHSTGSGHVYQGRFKSFPVQGDEHFFTVCRYVERNPLRAGIVDRAEDWCWASLSHRLRGTSLSDSVLSPWPLPRRADWVRHVNDPQTAAERDSMRQSIERGSPFGDPEWTRQMVGELGLESTVRPRGRPRKNEKGS